MTSHRTAQYQLKSLLRAAAGEIRPLKRDLPLTVSSAKMRELLDRRRQTEETFTVCKTMLYQQRFMNGNAHE